MIDPSTIEDFEDCDGERVHCFGMDTETGQFEWSWVHFEVLAEGGRQDIMRAVGMLDDWDVAA